MKINTPVEYQNPTTAEGGPASRITPLQELERTVMACMLWEGTFYEDGQSVADRIKALVPKVERSIDVAELAIKAREKMKLRHVPLLLMREVARHPRRHLYAEQLAAVIQRADELTEFLSIYWKDDPADKRQPLSKQIKRGLAAAFTKFNEYALAKYNRDGAVKLRDVLFLCHAKPVDEAQATLWKRLVDGNLQTPDTWEVALSAGADKKATFTRLIEEKKLGYLALLRNMRNMFDAGVDSGLVAAALIEGAANSRALPFRFIAAARAVPAWEYMVDPAMMRALAGLQRLPGSTVVLVDVSGSMMDLLSAKSDLRRIDAACALAALVRGISDDCRVFGFSDHLQEVPGRQGMALVDAIRKVPNGGTYLGTSLRELDAKAANADRIIIFTDEQTADDIPDPKNRGYIINVATNQNGIGYGAWVKINGFSEAVIEYIRAHEGETPEQTVEADEGGDASR